MIFLFLPTVTYPKLKTNPDLTVHESNSRLQFRCKVQSLNTNDSVRHEVTWYEGAPERKLNKMTILKGSESEAYLQNENDVQIFRLGTTVCSFN